MKEGVLVLAHGSKREEANQEVRDMVNLITEKDPEGIYQVAFLQNAQPNLGTGVADLAALGVRRIVVMPYFLVTGNHISQDIPGELDDLKPLHPEIQFEMTKHLNGHPGMVDIVLDRIDEARLKRR